MSQSINLENTERVIFNGQEVETVKLNGVEIWAGSFPKLAQLIDGSITEVTASDLEGITTIGAGAFSHCTNLTNITIPSTVTSIGSSAFYHCDSLTGVRIPEGITTIGTSMFGYCASLINVTLPSTVTSIGSSAFYYADVQELVVLSTTPPSLTSLSISNSNISVIKVPSESLETYKNASIWSNLADRMVGI